MVLGSTQPLTEMSNRRISWGVNAAGAYGWRYHLPEPLSWNLGTLTSWNPLGHSTDLPLPYSPWSHSGHSVKLTTQVTPHVLTWM